MRDFAFFLMKYLVTCSSFVIPLLACSAFVYDDIEMINPFNWGKDGKILLSFIVFLIWFIGISNYRDIVSKR